MQLEGQGYYVVGKMSVVCIILYADQASITGISWFGPYREFGDQALSLHSNLARSELSLVA